MTTPDWSTLPVPVDDGAAAHLSGMALPPVSLPSTGGATVDLGAIDGLAVLYVYPMTAEPDVPLPDDWDVIPGARGCTPQSCAFRDHAAELSALGVRYLFGISAQVPKAQAAAKSRLHLPFDLLSDEAGALGDALRLPTFEAGGRRLLKRLTMILEDARIVHVLYPVFPPDQDASNVVAWLRARATARGTEQPGSGRAG